MWLRQLFLVQMELKLLPSVFNQPEAGHVLCVHLAVNQSNALFEQTGRSGCKGQLRCIAVDGEHGLSKKNRPQKHPIKPACQLLFGVPVLNADGRASTVQLFVGLLHVGGNPGAMARRAVFVCALNGGTVFNDGIKCLVAGDGRSGAFQ